MYRIETTDPITGKSLHHLAGMPFVVETADKDSLVIYFESEQSRKLYLQSPAKHRQEIDPDQP